MSLAQLVVAHGAAYWLGGQASKGRNADSKAIGFIIIYLIISLFTWINGVVSHRFDGKHSFEGPILRKSIDRGSSKLSALEEIQIGSTYLLRCSIN